MVDYPNAKVKLIFSGTDFFQTLENTIEKATEIIHLQTYIFEEDATGSRIVDALARAVKRNVRIFVLADAYGSKGLSIEFIRKIQHAGISFRFFSPLFSRESIYPWRRLHHKVVVVDRTIGIVGGINIGDRYRGNEIIPPWLDYAALIEGEICAELHTICEHLYEKKIFRRGKRKTENRNQKKEDQPFLIRFNRNDWVKGKNEIYKSCLHSFIHSKKSIVIIASYFLPGYRYRKALRDARKRGVEIKIILAGKSDLPFFLHAEKYLYDFFARNGITIYEWPNSVLHGKAVIVDDEWVTVGSYNMNYLSHYRSIELNVELKDKKFAAVFLNHIKEITTNGCLEIDPDHIIHSKNIFIRIRNAFSYFIYRAIMKLFLPNKNLRRK